MTKILAATATAVATAAAAALVVSRSLDASLAQAFNDLELSGSEFL